MGEIKFKIHPLFIVLACIMIYFGLAGMFFCYIIVILLHEFGHSTAAARLGYSLNKFVLMPQGALVFSYQKFRVPSDEIKIALAGPLVNIVLAAITIALWWLAPESYAVTETFAFCNIMTAALNLLPVIPLDGGRIVLAIFSVYKKRRWGIVFTNACGIIISLLCFAIFIYSMFNLVNFTFLIMGVFILLGMIEGDRQHMYVNAFNLSDKMIHKGCAYKVNAFAISHNEKLGLLLKNLNRHKFNIAYVTNYETGEVLAKLFEGEIYKLLETKNLDVKIASCI